MTVVAEKIQFHILSYEDYMAEPEMVARYDILDGERVFMTQPTDRHQDIALSIAELFRRFQRSARTGRAKIAPCDVLITRSPLRTRQPDVMFISNERYAGRAPGQVSPYSPPPELVVEVLSPSEMRSIRAGKLDDYCRIDVQECWIIDPENETVEVLRRAGGNVESAVVYTTGQMVESVAFPGLSLAVNDIFEIE